MLYLDKDGLQEYTTKLIAREKQLFAPIAAVGAPATAATVADMTDTTKVYVYTGSETGYTNGDWYYYNGSDWVSGGVYNAAGYETDKTLTEEDVPADAKATGDAITALNGALLQKASIIYSEASGRLAHIKDGYGGHPISGLIATIEPKRAGHGTPSGSNIRTLSGYTGIEVTRSGKNIFNYDASKNISVVNSSDTARTAFPLPGGGHDVAFSASKSSSSSNAYAVVTSRLMDGVVNESNSFINTNQAFPMMQFFSTDGEPCFHAPNATYLTNTFALFNVQVEIGSDLTPYEAFNGVTKTLSWQTEAGRVFGGYIDFDKKKLTKTWDVIASYSGETLPSEWLSDRDEYAEGTTPTTGAQVVYKLATPVEYDLASTLDTIDLLDGINNIWCNTGGIESVIYAAKTKEFAEALNEESSSEIYEEIEKKAYTEVSYATIRIGKPFYAKNGCKYCFTAKLKNAISSAMSFYIQVNGSTKLTLSIPAGSTKAQGYYTMPANGDAKVSMTFYVGGNNQAKDVTVTIKNLDSIAERAKNSTIAPVLDDFVADTNLSVNDFRVIQGNLYIVTANIASGATITVGTNARKTDVGELLTALLNA